jgi:hypothetical protein
MLSGVTPSSSWSISIGGAVSRVALVRRPDRQAKPMPTPRTCAWCHMLFQPTSRHAGRRFQRFCDRRCSAFARQARVRAS